MQSQLSLLYSETFSFIIISYSYVEQTFLLNLGHDHQVMLKVRCQVRLDIISSFIIKVHNIHVKEEAGRISYGWKK